MDLRRNLATGQFDRMQRIEVALLAKEMGLDPTEYAQPFPGNQSITINHAPPASQRADKPSSGVGKLAAVALTAAGLGVAGTLGWPFLTAWAAKQATTRVIDRVITKPGTDYDVQVDMQVIPPK